ncbi:DNA polymerase I [Humitalea sp. 24SJ18S-53]|uniref:DNA polymerase I n=1 Tax=Humitalea sp. 24SJ18S-53 TaxID=3422307 RepID=UPI003D675D86
MTDALPDLLQPPPPDIDRHLILVDGSGYIFRAFHALPPMTNPAGVPVNAVFGFCNMLGQFLQKHAASHIAVVFDTSRVTFRQAIYDLYKANRTEPPPELVPQFSLIRDATDAFGVARIELDGFEADDLIATYARLFTESGGRVTIVSSDKDLMQLIRDGVIMLDPIKQKPIGPAEVMEKFGVAPDKVAEVQALAGDPTDNVPGVPGIGIKTAALLINEFGGLEALLAGAGTIKQPKRREALLDNADKARVSLRLVTLDPAVPPPAPIETLLARPPEPARLAGFLRDHGFRTTLHRFGLDEAVPNRTAPAVLAPAAPTDAPAPDGFGPYVTITDAAALQAWVDEATAIGMVALDTETDNLDALAASLVGVSLAVAPGRACYIPLRHTGLDPLSPKPDQMDFAEAIAILRPMFRDPSVLKVLHNAKYDLTVLGRAENGALEVSPIGDTMMVSYSLDAGRHSHGMDELSIRHLGHRPIPFAEVTGTGRTKIPFAAVQLDKATAYAAEDADVTWRLYQVLFPRLLPEKALATYELIERRMIGVLRDMEAAGVLVDGRELARIGGDFGTRMAELEIQIHKLAGRPFNLGSPKQLGEILFDEQGLPGGKRTKTGAWSTDAAALEELAARGHDLPKQLLEWRQYQKLKSTYVEGLTAQIAGDGRVHTDYALAVTSTGRLSSTEPNLQNIPIRTEAGARIRRAFIAAPGTVLISADYSQIELRLLAHLADVPTLRAAFANDEDIHSRTASDIFGMPLGEVDREARRRAKTINFGIIYGMGAFGLGARLGISAGEAKGIIDAYFARYPGIKDEMDRLKKEAKENGFVRTPFGRRLWIEGIDSKIQGIRGNAERAAINAPFQGGAAEIIKRAMVRMPHALEEAGLTARMLLQVHDELLFETPLAEAEAMSALAKRVMEGVANLRVPLKVEVGQGANWGEAH